MISITADSYWHLMAKQQYLQFTWGQVGVVISGTAGALWLVLSVVTQDIRDRLLSIDTSISQFNITLKSHGESIAGINERMKGLDRRVELIEKAYWGPKARASGIEASQIIPTSLQSQVKFESEVEVGAKKIALYYTILKYDPVNEVMTLRVDGGAPGVEIRNNVFTLSTKLGRFVELPNLFIGFPKLYMQIIDRPSPDQAILAIGEKIKASDKSS